MVYRAQGKACPIPLPSKLSSLRRIWIFVASQILSFAKTEMRKLAPKSFLIGPTHKMYRMCMESRMQRRSEVSATMAHLAARKSAFGKRRHTIHDGNMCFTQSLSKIAAPHHYAAALIPASHIKNGKKKRTAWSENAYGPPHVAAVKPEKKADETLQKSKTGITLLRFLAPDKKEVCRHRSVQKNRSLPQQQWHGKS